MQSAMTAARPMRLALRLPLLSLAAGVLLLACACGASAAAAAGTFDIRGFGAVPGDSSNTAALANTLAIQSAFKAASAAAASAQRADAAADAELLLEQRWDAVLEHSRASYDPDHPQSDSSLALLLPASTVLVPAGLEFTIAYTPITGVANVLFQLNGTLLLSTNQSLWESQSLPEGYYGALHFIECDAITVQGKAQSYDSGAALASHVSSSPSATMLPTSAVDIVGGGYGWWWAVLLGPVDHRPHMVYMERCRGMAFLRLFVTDAPMFHFLAEDGQDLYFKNVTIHVNVDAQKELTSKAGFAHAEMPRPAALFAEASGPAQPSFSIPTFPLNTDGIDPSVERALIEDFSITCFDDAVAVKPCQGDGKLCTCASDMTVRNGATRWTVGLTIGSVPPHPAVNCVRNITFDSIAMTLPFKALYIKTNPGDVGSGVIDQIRYSNVAIDTPLWYPLWIGPQQQKQPANGTDTGCSFFYPLNDTCPTQPRISISGVAIVNVTSTGGLTLPGVLLCDPANPCTGIDLDHFSNAPASSWIVGKEYVCKNAQGQQNDAQPTMACLDQRGADQRLTRSQSQLIADS